MTVVNLDKQTVAKLTALPSGKTAVIYRDAELKGFGLGLRLGGDGRVLRSYQVQFRASGMQRKVKIGDAAKLTVDQARKKATEILAKVTLGVDPAADQRRDVAVLKFSAAVQQFLELKQRELRPGSLKLATLYLSGKQYFGSLHSRPLSNIERSDIATCLNSILVNSGTFTASRCRAHISALFTWCMTQGHAEANPVIGTATPATTSRDRVLDNRELAAVWNAVDGATEFGKIMRLLILSGARRGEIGGLKWSEIDEAGVLRIDGERTKNHHALELPLPPLALEIIASVPRMVGRDQLFGLRAGKGFTQFDPGKLSLKDVLTKPWKIHDIRRSVVTGMAELGIQPHIIETVVNHSSGHKAGIVKVYNHATYKPEVKRALALWADHIDSIVNESPRKVLAFTGR